MGAYGICMGFVARHCFHMKNFPSPTVQNYFIYNTHRAGDNNFRLLMVINEHVCKHEKLGVSRGMLPQENV